MTTTQQERHRRAVRVMSLVQRIRPMLEGQGPDVQMAVVAHLTAVWLSGYKGADRQARDERRAEVGMMFLAMVGEMLKIEDGETEKS